MNHVQSSSSFGRKPLFCKARKPKGIGDLTKCRRTSFATSSYPVLRIAKLFFVQIFDLQSLRGTQISCPKGSGARPKESEGALQSLWFAKHANLWFPAVCKGQAPVQSSSEGVRRSPKESEGVRRSFAIPSDRIRTGTLEAGKKM